MYGTCAANAKGMRPRRAHLLNVRRWCKASPVKMHARPRQCSWGPGRSLTEKKKCSVAQFSQKSPRALHVFNHGWWRLAVGGWRLAVGGDWRLAVGHWRLVVVGGGWWLAVGGWWWLVVVGRWRLVAVGGLRRLVAVGGWWGLAVGGWWSLGAVLNEKKIWFLKDRPAGGCQKLRTVQSEQATNPKRVLTRTLVNTRLPPFPLGNMSVLTGRSCFRGPNPMASCRCFELRPHDCSAQSCAHLHRLCI